MAVEIRTTMYEWSHGQKPRGSGRWGFKVETGPRAGLEYWSAYLPYSDACRVARSWARGLENVTTLRVLP